MKNTICKRCGNKDLNQFSFNNGKFYCRRCIEFNKPVKKIRKKIKPVKTVPRLNYYLSIKQLELSNIIVNSSKDIYISAVTGSGKTEITLKAIANALGEGKRVGFVIPRKTIVIEIASRLRKIFPDIKICEVYQGSKYDYDGDIIVLTAHQAYRYTGKFGLLIVDEYDAFPLRDNAVLKDIVDLTSYGKRVYLSATFEKELLINKQVGTLNKRYHNYPLPEPIFIKKNSLYQFIFLAKAITDATLFKRKLIVYFPTIRILKIIASLMLKHKHKIIITHSQIKEVNTIIKDLYKMDYFIVFSTIILERGITIPNVNVMVFNADHRLFNVSSLIQIAGRVGRLKNYPTGDVVFLGKEHSNDIKESIKRIKNFNS
jgi:competence protein ComFA